MFSCAEFLRQERKKGMKNTNSTFPLWEMNHLKAENKFESLVIFCGILDYKVEEFTEISMISKFSKISIYILYVLYILVNLRYIKLA